VRDLAALFKTRIELKQIGVRDEAKRLGGVGRCGREYCSASWLPDLRPVNLGVAKDQKLSLNPQQISGACGRLMCCLRYEHEFYVQSRRKFPKEGKILATSRGEEKVVSCDIFNERVTLRTADGDVRVLELAELKIEVGESEAVGVGAGVGVGVALAAAEPPDAALEAGTLSMLDTAEYEVMTRQSVEFVQTVATERVVPAERIVRDEWADEPLVEDARATAESPGEAAGESADGAQKRKRRRGRRGGRRLRAAEERRPTGDDEGAAGDAASDSDSDSEDNGPAD
jgi:hypothetical protein